MSLEDILHPLVHVYEQAPQPIKSCVGWAYRRLPSRVKWGAHYDRFQDETSAVENWNRDQTEAYQLKALKDTLMAASQTPYYKNQFAAAGVKPASFASLSDLKNYPLLTKQDVIKNRDSLLNPLISPARRLSMSSGGSSGEPLSFYLEKGISRPKEQAYLEASWNRRGWKSGDRTAVLRGQVVSGADNGKISYYDASRNWLVMSAAHLTEDRIKDYLEQLNAFKPLHLHAYPSAALTLAHWMHEHQHQFDFQLTSILCGSEKLEPQAQAFLEEVFGARVQHWYGHSERVVLASQGRTSDHLYFWPTYGFVEFGDEDENGFREIIGTSFHNQVMPFVRYRTGDLVNLSSGTDNEFQWPAVERVMGRDYEFLISSSGRRVSLTAINMHDGVFEGLLAVQFQQSAPGKVELHYQPGDQWQTTKKNEIRDKVSMKLGQGFELYLKRVSNVQKTANGKHRWLVTTLL